MAGRPAGLPVCPTGKQRMNRDNQTTIYWQQQTTVALLLLLSLLRLLMVYVKATSTTTDNNKSNNDRDHDDECPISVVVFSCYYDSDCACTCACAHERYETKGEKDRRLGAMAEWLWSEWSVPRDDESVEARTDSWPAAPRILKRRHDAERWFSSLISKRMLMIMLIATMTTTLMMMMMMIMRFFHGADDVVYRGFAERPNSRKSDNGMIVLLWNSDESNENVGQNSSRRWLWEDDVDRIEEGRFSFRCDRHEQAGM